MVRSGPAAAEPLEAAELALLVARAGQPGACKAEAPGRDWPSPSGDGGAAGPLGVPGHATEEALLGGFEEALPGWAAGVCQRTTLEGGSGWQGGRGVPSTSNASWWGSAGLP